MKVNETILKEIAEELQMGSKVYLHRETGKIITLPEEDIFIDEEEDPWAEDRQKVESDPDKYLEFEPMESNESYEMMEDFIKRLDEEPLATRIANAIRKKRPFNISNSVSFFVGVPLESD